MSPDFYHLDVTRNPFTWRIHGTTDRTFSTRRLLLPPHRPPLNHPLRDQYPHGRWVQTLGPCSHREAVIKGIIRRAEVLGGYEAPTSRASTTTVKPTYLHEVYTRWVKAMPRTADTVATCDRALKLYEEQPGKGH